MRVVGSWSNVISSRGRCNLPSCTTLDQSLRRTLRVGGFGAEQSATQPPSPARMSPSLNTFRASGPTRRERYRAREVGWAGQSARTHRSIQSLASRRPTYIQIPRRRRPSSSCYRMENLVWGGDAGHGWASERGDGQRGAWRAGVIRGEIAGDK